MIEAVPDETPELKVFHAGTKRADGQLLANGGRVLNVTALGGSVAEAKMRAYAAVAEVRLGATDSAGATSAGGPFPVNATRSLIVKARSKLSPTADRKGL